MKRSPALPFDLSGIHLQPGQGLARQLYQALRERILDGRLASGTRLPASRELATLLGISRNTVTRALDQLYAEGYVNGRVGDGTYVAELTRRRPAAIAAVAPAAASPALQLLQSHHLAMPAAGAPRAFRIGVPAFDLFPFETWARLQARFWRKPSLARLGYGDPAGDLQLRELIAAYLRNSRGLTCEAQQVLITCGSQQAISLCAQLLIQPGDRVAIENPGYRAAGHAFAVAGAQLCGVLVDHDGLDVDALQRLNDCRLAYVTPAHQYPTGVTLSLPRRLALLEWAKRVNGWIIEDDYDGEYRYAGAPLPALKSLDGHDRVLYAGSFSKVLYPGLALGYLVVPESLRARFDEAVRIASNGCAQITQATVADFMRDGHFSRHLKKMRLLYARRRALLAEALQKAFGDGVRIDLQAGGMHLIARFDTRTESDLVLARRAQEAGLNCQPLSARGTTAFKGQGLLMGFTNVASPAQARQLATRLRAALG